MLMHLSIPVQWIIVVRVDNDCDGSKDEHFVATATTCGIGSV